MLGVEPVVGKGQTVGCTEGAIPVSVDSQNSQIVHKDYVLDYTSLLKNVIMVVHDDGSCGLTYRYVCGLGKLSAMITGGTNGVGGVMQYIWSSA